MGEIPADVLLAAIGGSTEPLVIVSVDDPDWPVLLANPAFEGLADGREALQAPFPDVIEPLIGREMTREAGAALRARRQATFPVDVGSREYLLTLLPMPAIDGDLCAHFAVYWRTVGRQVSLPANGSQPRSSRRSAEATGEDSVTGLMSERAFREVLEHDWDVAEREGTLLGLTIFCFDDYAAYKRVFGKHGADSSLKRVARIVSRSLKRASDVAARIDDAHGGRIVVLSHGSNQETLDEFAERTATAVRDLGLHHPRSSVQKFVTVSYCSKTCRPREITRPPAEALGKLLKYA